MNLVAMGLATVAYLILLVGMLSAYRQTRYWIKRCGEAEARERRWERLRDGEEAE